MKLLFLFLGLTILKPTEGTGFYDIQFKTIDGTIVNTSAYQGKKVIVAVVSASAQNLSLIEFLDSMQKNSSVQVIAVPTGDFGGSIKASDLKSLKKNLSIVVSEPLSVKKANTAAQHSLFAWLTRVSENHHFDMDVTGEGQVFIVSAKGTLYSVLPNITPHPVISKIVNQPFAD
jgi:glutathione peroxidase-family protein